MSGPGNVYLLRHGTSHWYKIGRTINTAAKRICSGLATGNPEGLTEVASWFCETRHGDFESLLHALFQEYHLHGRTATEFFDFSHAMTEEQLRTLIDKEHQAFTADLINESEEPVVQTSEAFKPGNVQVETLLQERRALAATVKRAEIRMKTIDALLKQYISSDAGLEDLDGRQAISWKTQQRQVLDSAALRQAHPDLAATFTKTTDVRVFRML